MKNMRKIITIIVLALFAFVLVACGEEETGKKEENKVVSIIVNDGNETICDEFDFDTAKFTVKFEDGTTIDTTSAEVSINDEDYEKIFENGVHQVRLNYKGQEVASVIALCENPADIIVPTTALYLITKTHYENGVHYTSFYIGGKEDQSQYYAFEFKFNYTTDVTGVKIIKGASFGDELEINDNGSRISINFVNSTPGAMNTELMRVEYTSESMYKNFKLDSASNYGFYRVTNDNVYILNSTQNLNW